MRIVSIRRISQVFFFVLFVWFCVVMTIGDKFYQTRGWDVNLLLQIDPLVGIGTVLSTHTLYWPLLLGLVTIVFTILLGRFFCSWVCPFGSIHHCVGYLAHRKKTNAQKIKLNRYRKGQVVKYFILIVFLIMAAFPTYAATLQTGLLDPIPLLMRSFNLVILPILDRAGGIVNVTERFYEGAWLIFAIFLAAVLLNFVIPRFYCRFVCPLGAFLGVINRLAFWRIGKSEKSCCDSKLCERHCEGGCEPAGAVRISECVLCFNCIGECKDELVGYNTFRSRSGEVTGPDISRRGFALSVVGGLFGLGAIRLGNKLGENWFFKIIRPPGALAEAEFLKRCIKCGQCMRICPTNVIQPASAAGGLEVLWTPVLNNRIGSSGCQLNCTACGQICPTSAIRPISLAEKLGVNEFAEKGPIKLGTAFVDRNRCLPWAMDKPCIVCEENCPVSPKAIYTQELYNTIRDGELTVKAVSGNTIRVEQLLETGKYGTGDYYIAIGESRSKVTSNDKNSLAILAQNGFNGSIEKGSKVELQIRLQRPFIDIEKCIGCGVCEHECPVSGKRAVRITAEGESRSFERKLLLEG